MGTSEPISIPPPSPESDTLRDLLSAICFDTETLEEWRQNIATLVPLNRLQLESWATLLERLCVHGAPEQLLGAPLWMVVTVGSEYAITTDAEAYALLTKLAQLIRETLQA